MTREEAIKHIKDIICENNTVKHSDIVVFEEEKEALRMAIKALEQEPCEDAVLHCCDCNGQQTYKCTICKDKSQFELKSCDCVSREAVMKIVDEEWLCNADYDFRSLVESLEQLPSITPTHKHVESTQKNNDNTLDALGDAVSRQAVINAIENDCMKGGLGSCFACYNDAQAFRGEIEKLPSVTVRQTECEKCCDGIQTEKAKLCQKSYLAGMEHRDKQEPCEDAVSRKAVLDLVVANHIELNGVNVVMYSPLCKDIKDLPPVTQKSIECDDAIIREFVELVVEYPPADLCTYPEYKGKPYYSIKYRENGEGEFVGYGTYKPEVLSRYLKEYFIPSITQKSETVTEFADRCRECGKMRKGHWKYDKTIENWRCSKCNETPKTMGYVGTADFMAEHFKFCNHCGAKMVEPQKGR